MANRYAGQQIGVADGTAIPAARADAREVNSKKKVLIASKRAGTDAWNTGDVIYLGKKPAGWKVTDVKLVTGTSLGTSTVDVGVGTDPRSAFGTSTADKYVDGATLTTTDVPTSIGPKASTVDDTPGAEEHLYATIGVANIAAAVAASFLIEMAAA